MKSAFVETMIELIATRQQLFKTSCRAYAKSIEIRGPTKTLLATKKMAAPKRRPIQTTR